ncbi:TM2 domain-containing protein [Akkermansia glycaniphila]|uniref:Tm2 domain n=1 Tax=Akkermansia glycaniphila TaxID=1679444 RepID=A0A1H6MKP2_9BACT|nr:TM2 domain-containing protein [Akkermansia glycaniphila]SEH99796.1 tm2 domain [Akkermansia glycaniphila]
MKDVPTSNGGHAIRFIQPSKENQQMNPQEIDSRIHELSLEAASLRTTGHELTPADEARLNDILNEIAALEMQKRNQQRQGGGMPHNTAPSFHYPQPPQPGYPQPHSGYGYPAPPQMTGYPCVQQQFMTGGVPLKSKTTCLIMCILLGGFGAHRFYVGKAGTGILSLLTLGCFGVWTIIDLILICTDKFKDGFNRPLGS